MSTSDRSVASNSVREHPREEAMSFISRLRIAWHALVALTFASLAYAAPAHAADPMKVGVSLSLTGGVAANGKQILMALELWRDDVNAKGGLLGRPVEIVYYDDQSNPSTVPALYTKLITADKVDLLLGPYATNMVAPAMPVIMQNNKTTISFLAIGMNQHFKYPKYFSMVPVGPKGPGAFSDGFFELAAAQSPKPQTVAIVSADAEFAKTAADAARDNGSRLHGRVRAIVSADGDRFPAGHARDTGREPRHRVCCRLSARYRRHHSCGKRNQSRA